MMAPAITNTLSLRTLVVYTLLLHFTLSFTAASNIPYEDGEICDSPLGMETGKIPDEDISVSSEYDKAFGATQARIYDESAGGAWCPSHRVSADGPEEWLQIRLPSVHRINLLATQGRFGNGKGTEYTEFIRIKYMKNKRWVEYQDRLGNQILRANQNQYMPEFVHLDPGIKTDVIRIIPTSDSPRDVCLRVELYGCEARNHYTPLAEIGGWH